MINSHQFREAAKKFRAGRISLTEFNDFVFGKEELRKPNEAATVTSNADDPKAASSDGASNESHDIMALLKRLNARNVDAHKGDFGRVMAIGGSEGMAGAISLTGVAALRAGSGLVRVAVPDIIKGLVAANNPCLMTLGCASDGDGFHGGSASSLTDQADWSDVIAMGPGMGRGEAQQWIVKNLYSNIAQPMVIDADGINGLADASVDLSEHEGQRILTPHPGEFFRLTGKKETCREKLEASAKQMAAEADLVIVLKGSQTYVTDGTHEYRNESGNPGMATAGAGDVLTGVITSFVGQGFSPLDAAILGVYTHGEAGDLAAKKVGQVSLMATDIVDALSEALRH